MKLKLLILGDPSSVHILRWVRALSENDIQILLCGVQEFDPSYYNNLTNVRVESLNLNKELTNSQDGSLQKLVYLRLIIKLNKLIVQYKPDILHSHYVSSYGLIGALVNYHPFIISVWGADIYRFPLKSFFHRSAVKFSLSRADRILSTSNIMAEEVNKYSDKKVDITPFGVDENKFKIGRKKIVFSENDFVVGIIKKLEKKYGIIYLIQAFKILTRKNPDKSIKLLIVGSGSERKILEQAVHELELSDKVLFTGFVSHDDIPEYFQSLDICCIPSIEDSESFGVAALEAGACGIPVVASRVGGLAEVIEDNVTGFLVEKGNPVQLSNKIEKLMNDKDLRVNMGMNGRKRVLNEYTWTHSVQKMLSIYNSLLEDTR